MRQELVNRATNQKLYANDFQKVGCSGQRWENSDSPDFRPKGAEPHLDTLNSFKEKALPLAQVLEIPCFGKSIDLQWYLFRQAFSHSIRISFEHFYFISLSFVGSSTKIIAFQDFSFGRGWVVLKRTEFCLFRRMFMIFHHGFFWPTGYPWA